MSRVYILLINWNGWRDTLECLESLLHLDYPDYRVIIVDNASTDGSCDYFRMWANNQFDLLHIGPRCEVAASTGRSISFAEYDRNEAELGGDASRNAFLTVIRSMANLGFAGGNNVGLRYVLARDDANYIWLLNNDTVVAPDALRALVDRMQDRPEVGMCGSTLLRYSAPHKVQARGGGWYCKWIGLPWHIGQLRAPDSDPQIARVERWMNYVIGASMLVSKTFLQDVGLMCEDYFLYFEEVDWAIRAKGKYQLSYAEKSVVYHKIGSSIGTSSNPANKSSICDYYSIRNRIYFTKKFYPWALPTVYITLLFALLIRMIFGKWESVAMILKLLITHNYNPGELHFRKLSNTRQIF